MRKAIFWIHLTSGVMAGLIILSMCVTGVLLTFERQMRDWADRRDARVAPAANAARLPVADLIAKADAVPSAVIVRSDPAEPVELVVNKDRTLYLNPYTGAVTGEPSKRMRAFFESVRDWHRWFAGGPAAQKVTQPIYDAANLIFFGIVLSGPILWWPKKSTWRHFRPILWFRGSLSGKARDFNWHNAIGVWTSIPLALIVASGILLSYEWSNNLLYWLASSGPPKQQRPIPMSKSEAVPPWQGVDVWISRAAARMPDWRTITIRGTPGRNVDVNVDSGTGGQPQYRAFLTLDRLTGNELKWASFDAYRPGFKVRVLARVVHTGEVGGVMVQALAGLVSSAGAMLVYTGGALSLRRFAAWRRRRSRLTHTAHLADAGAAV